jgi:hypothetical protein
MPPATPDHLDTLLAAWARDQRLADADAVRIRQAITGEPPAFAAATWWSEFNSRISTAIVRATATPVPALAALR